MDPNKLPEIEMQLVVLRIKSKILAIRIWHIGTGGAHIKLEHK